MAGIRAISLNAVTAIGAGAPFVFGPAKSRFTMQVVHTGSPTVVKVDLEGTLDGANWFVLTVWDSADSLVSGSFVERAQVSCSQVRANLKTLTGGTAPTVTARIIAED